MKKLSISKFEIISTIFIMLFGVLLHFTYELTNYNSIVGFFSAVNESTWEHLKLIFFPTLITTIIGYFIYKNEYSNYLCSKTKGIIASLLFIIIFYYSYTGVLGTNISIINILSFFVAVLIGQVISYRNIISYKLCNNYISISILIMLIILFFIFTYYPPNLGIFNIPNTCIINLQ